MRRGALLVALALLAGCSRRPRAEDYVPTAAAAESALESFLSAWKRGEPVSPVAGTSPAVNGADIVQAEGRKLADFRVLGPVPADAPHCFLVRLTLDGPREVRDERYVVIGWDPIWVMRHGDYEMVKNWDHPMPPAGK